MKTLKTFNTFNESKVGDQAIGLDIKNQISTLVDGGKGGTIDLGIVGQVDDNTIHNIKQTYKNATINVVDGHYILNVNE